MVLSQRRKLRACPLSHELDVCSERATNLPVGAFYGLLEEEEPFAFLKRIEWENG
jgi:hypothetical protein